MPHLTTSRPKGQGIGINIKEPAPQQPLTSQPDKSKDSSQADKHQGNKKVGEMRDAHVPTRACTESTSKGSRSLLESIFSPKPDDKIILYKGFLFGMQIPFDKNALFPSNTTATMLNNY